jgi:hypothetical protein
MFSKEFIITVRIFNKVLGGVDKPRGLRSRREKSMATAPLLLLLPVFNDELDLTFSFATF